MRLLLSLILSASVWGLVLPVASAEDLPHLVPVNDNILRGGLPSENGIKQLHARGIKTIIDIENNKSRIDRERKWVVDNNMEFISIPLSALSSPADKDIDEALSLLINSQKFPIYIHCLHGEDRTGLVVGLYRVLVEKWTPKTAHDEMITLNFHPFYENLENYFWQRTSRP